ncbi:hypothetical protein GCM10018790_63900 [Kitasatospora xanthocidica]|uniref:hypothetical protein n=1 Tax=Kitasatospora xanthocidica TaxID=83382 RepID=UPI0016747912|nr:hypothetical protein [Kitasatospora xanthocidica]GHF77027.1 hypothetical protein GCM10018790_63900 [Kitasatospora xanthocidica]
MTEHAPPQHAVPARPLTARPGWQAVTDALADHKAAGVLTWTRGMVHDDEHATAFDRLADILRERGAFLAAAHPATAATPVGTVPPRRSAGDRWRRRELSSSAAGLFVSRRAAGHGTDPRNSGC